MLITLAISGYRSLRDVSLPLKRLNVVTGHNGSGKSSLYRAIQLLASVSQGRVTSALAREGGLSSTLWAGPEEISSAVRRGEHPVQGTRRKGAVRLRLGFASEDFGYAIDLGLPTPSLSLFGRDPEIKAEAVWIGERLRRSNALATRAGPLVTGLDASGKRIELTSSLAAFDSMMTHAASTKDSPEIYHLRERMRSWRFYDQLRTDAEAGCRGPQVGTRTVALADDGSDIAAAMQTIMEIGQENALAEAIDDAFPGSRVEIVETGGFFELALTQNGLLRPLRASELSDGTMRFLLLAAALLTPRPPSLLVFNEPETSLHPDLLPPLARLIIRASRDSQIIIVTHARPLVEALGESGAQILSLSKEFGETRIAGVDPPPFDWPKR
jgi:predicted ATPase